ncbi:MAG: acetyl-CoA decarbonylase/synthase complex subunit gamma [Actinomycetota bacterium]
MALTGLDIYKKLPKTNCGECGFPACLPFAMKLAAGQAELDACPYLSEDIKEELAEASAPPIRLVTIGAGENALKIGEEQVMFRHEKTFFHPPGMGLIIEDTDPQEIIDGKINQTREVKFERVGQILKSDIIAIKASSGDASKFVSLVGKVKDTLDIPMVLTSDDPEIMKAALSICAEDKPLIYAANNENSEAMTNLSKEYDCPLAVSANGLEDLSSLVEKILALGVKHLVLDPGSENVGSALRDLVLIRRAALKQKFRPLGYPVITFPCSQTEDDLIEAALAAIYIMKYGGIILLRNLEPWKALPLFVLRQNIYTDPQRPMRVEEGIYPIGNPSETSPVLITSNFSLTYFIVSGEIEASKIPSWLLVLDTEGLSVMTSWAAGKFVPETIAPFVKRSGITDKVEHHKLVIPGCVAQISGELEDELSDWEIIVGPREAGDIPAFLKHWAA